MSVFLYPFAWILRMLYLLVQNYGIALILFSLVIKFILLPLNMKSKRSMMKTSRLTPKLKALEQKYGCFRRLDGTDPQEGDRVSVADFAVPLEDTALAGTQSESGAEWYVARRLSEGVDADMLAVGNALWERLM